MNLMLLKDFFQIFPDEESCIDYFRQIREEVGITCPKCGYTEHILCGDIRTKEC